MGAHDVARNRQSQAAPTDPLRDCVRKAEKPLPQVRGNAIAVIIDANEDFRLAAVEGYGHATPVRARIFRDIGKRAPQRIRSHHGKKCRPEYQYG